MKVAGFTFVRNAIKFDYPIVEAIQSILPICDVVYVAVGKSEDATLEIIEQIPSDKIRVIKTIWNEELREGGRVLAEETNKAFQAIPDEYDWAFYIQGDEVVHEADLISVQKGMQDYKHRKDVDGLLFNYRHFFGSYDYVGDSPRWYAKEIRVIKNNKNIYSYKDAQGFRKDANKKLNVAPVAAHINHYGWVKDPRVMQAKQESFNKLWHDDNWMKENIPDVDQYDYFSNIDSLERFKGSHPKVMHERIKRLNWEFNYDVSFNKSSPKHQVKKILKKLGIDTSYKNYRVVAHY
jgi:hypothetical protein